MTKFQNIQKKNSKTAINSLNLQVLSGPIKAFQQRLTNDSRDCS